MLLAQGFSHENLIFTTKLENEITASNKKKIIKKWLNKKPIKISWQKILNYQVLVVFIFFPCSFQIFRYLDAC